MNVGRSCKGLKEIDLRHFDPIAKITHNEAINENKVIAQINILVSQSAALLSGASDLTEDQSIDLAYQALALHFSEIAEKIDLASTDSIKAIVTQLATLAGASKEGIASVDAFINEASQGIAHLNQAINDIDKDIKKEVLVEIAAIQLAADEIEEQMKKAGEKLAFNQFTSEQKTTLNKAIETALYEIGDVDGDGTNDALVLEPTPTPTTEPTPEPTIKTWIDEEKDNFTYTINSSNFIIESRETGEFIFKKFNVSEDTLTFTDVANGTTTTELIVETLLINSTDTETKITFDVQIINNDDIVVAEEGVSLIILGVSDFSTIDFSVA